MSSERYREVVILKVRAWLRSLYWKFGDWQNDPTLKDEMRVLWMEGFEAGSPQPKKRGKELFS